MQKLKSLDLNLFGCRGLQDIEGIAKLPQLTGLRLTLQKCRELLSVAGLRALQGLPLTTLALSLDGCAKIVTAAELMSLGSLSQLQDLTLSVANCVELRNVESLAAIGRRLDPPVEVVSCGGVRAHNGKRFLAATGHLHASCRVASNDGDGVVFDEVEAERLRGMIDVVRPA